MSVLLKDIALDQYYAIVSNKGLSLEQTQAPNRVSTKYPKSLGTDSTQNHGNPAKSRTECLLEMLLKLSKLQHGILLEQRTPEFLRMKVISACWPIHACSVAMWHAQRQQINLARS